MWPSRLFVLHPKPSGTHQPLPRQTGPQITLNEPNEGLWARQDFQKEIAANLLTIPMSAISGTLLLRSGQVSIDHFNAEISDEFPYPRAIFVPIDLPTNYERAVKSAARRALGPMSDVLERSGVAFTMRSIGARKVRANAGANASAAAAAYEEDDDDSVQSVHSEAGDHQADAEEQDLSAIPLDIMSAAQLKKQFGRSALDVVGAMWQHQSKIAEQARFMPKDDMISYMTASGRKSVMRRSQVHPTVIYSALRSVISTSATGISSQDAFVQMAGGTPEGIVAGIMIGFQKVIYIPSTDKEASWMSMPSQAAEYSNKVDYMNYTSPDPEDPERGFLAAEAVKLLVPYIRNFVMDNKNIMVPPPFPIDIPPLQTFTHIAVTGRVLARTMLVTPKKENPSNEEKTQGGPGSPSGSTPPPKPKIQSKIVQVTGNTGSVDDGMPDDEENEEDDVEESEKGEEDDINELEKLENAASSKKPKPKGASSKRQSSKTKGAAKKKAKGSKD